MGVLVIDPAIDPVRIGQPERGRPALLRRLWSAFLQSRRLAAEREVARFLARHPGLAGAAKAPPPADWKAAADALPF